MDYVIQIPYFIKNKLENNIPINLAKVNTFEPFQSLKIRFSFDGREHHWTFPSQEERDYAFNQIQRIAENIRSEDGNQDDIKDIGRFF